MLEDSKRMADHELINVRGQVDLARSQLHSMEEELEHYHNLHAAAPGPTDALQMEQEQLLRAKIDILTKANTQLVRRVEDLEPRCARASAEADRQGLAADELRGQLQGAMGVHTQMKEAIAVLTKELQEARYVLYTDINMYIQYAMTCISSALFFSILLSTESEQPTVSVPAQHS
jgi:chromosome segregation ATPase